MPSCTVGRLRRSASSRTVSSSHSGEPEIIASSQAKLVRTRHW